MQERFDGLHFGFPYREPTLFLHRPFDHIQFLVRQMPAGEPQACRDGELKACADSIRLRAKVQLLYKYFAGV